MELDLAAQRTAVIKMAQQLAVARKTHEEACELLDSRQYKQGGELVMQAAKMGDAMAQDHLGFLYERGFFTSGAPEWTLAIEWYRKAAEQMLPYGQFHLGVCYHLGNGVEQDYEEAARLFDLAAKAGHPEAAECLEILKNLGIEPGPAPVMETDSVAAALKAAIESPPAKPTEEEEEEEREAAARRTRKRAEERSIVEEMPEVPAEFDDPAVSDAVEAYQAQAMKNDAAAQLKLGLAYYKGRSAPENPKLACFWVMRAMLAGSQQAAQLLKYCVQRVPQGEQEKVQTSIFMWAPGQPVPML